MIKVFCDKCQAETKNGYCSAELKLFSKSDDHARTYALTFCPKCMNELDAKMRNEGYDRI